LSRSSSPVDRRKSAREFHSRALSQASSGRTNFFLDIAGSTALAEKLGDIGVHSLITRFFLDIEEPIWENGGEVHRYIGDEVVVTWPLSQGLKDCACLKCYFDVVDRVDAMGENYERLFGAKPQFLVGIHGKPVEPLRSPSLNTSTAFITPAADARR
jgi:class 3 adenylate cyclase